MLNAKLNVNVYGISIYKKFMMRKNICWMMFQEIMSWVAVNSRTGNQLWQPNQILSSHMSSHVQCCGNTVNVWCNSVNSTLVHLTHLLAANWLVWIHWQSRNSRCDIRTDSTSLLTRCADEVQWFKCSTCFIMLWFLSVWGRDLLIYLTSTVDNAPLQTGCWLLGKKTSPW